METKKDTEKRLMVIKDDLFKKLELLAQRYATVDTVEDFDKLEVKRNIYVTKIC